MKEHQVGSVLAIGAAMLWGTTGTAQALAPIGANPLSVGATRLIIGGSGLLALALIKRSLYRHPRWLSGTTLLGIVAVAAYQISFFAGVSLTGVALGTVIGIGSAPILTGFITYFFLGQTLGGRWLVGTAFAVSGGALLLLEGRSVGIHVGGMLLAMGAGLSYSLYTLASKALLDTDLPPDGVMAVFFSGGALLLAPFLLLADAAWLRTSSGVLVALHLGLVATTLSYVLYAGGLRRISAATVVTLTLAEPLTAALLGIFLLGEPLTPLGAVGIGLVFLGLYWVRED